MNDEKDWFAQQGVVTERPFTSTTPLIGPLLARFRALWNSISTQWYVRPLLAQQNAYNRLLADRLQDIDTRLVAQDHELTQLVHDTAELTTQVIQMNRRLAAIETHLAALSTQHTAQKRGADDQ
ncbi:MAG: hypothetical protein KC443_07630 [Anaerolineales bacterium]|nr:hypothetical protein [Anaerolineales bacterium]